ncbi:hypothetical protein GWI33_003795 [Rhynchophorus ferrugineus]|uniref:Uncharacterized protein n=1 Tax=Rhynchophorus ferrugineus TaxID=354439 RepID=A0A834HLZ4_RHYFE|nr:hypothetical protein GWI33_003795 [Rhynchophorus ferrugineus]
MNTADDERSGRPKKVAGDENIKKIHKMILNDRKLKLNEIADTLKISNEHVHRIIHEYLGMRKFWAKWVRASSLLTKNNDELMIRSSI